MRRFGNSFVRGFEWTLGRDFANMIFRAIFGGR